MVVYSDQMNKTKKELGKTLKHKPQLRPEFQKLEPKESEIWSPIKIGDLQTLNLVGVQTVL